MNLLSESGGKTVNLPGISPSQSLSRKNIQSHSSSSIIKNCNSVDSCGDSDISNYAKTPGAEASLSARQMQFLFPYHISVDKDFNVIQFGEKLHPLVRNVVGSTTARRRMNQHMSKYFRITYPPSAGNWWDAKILTSLNLNSPDSCGIVELQLVGKDKDPFTSVSQRLGAQCDEPCKLILRGKFHDLTNCSASTAPVIYECDASEGNAGDTSGGGEGGTYLFLMQLVSNGDDNVNENWSNSSFMQTPSAALSPASAHASALTLVRNSSSEADTITKLLAINAELKEENERLKNEAKGDDLRGLIGNVAHDLKTPLSAFMTGVDLIKTMADACAGKQAIDHQVLLTQQVEQERISPRTKSGLDLRIKESSHQYNELKSISQQAIDLKDINNFMTMTINRCIDYTKASKGVKLVPRNETINLTETLAMPINCIIASHSKISFCLQPPSSDICSHIITDKIWLQENILCLLSNAAKYSNAGRVDIHISLFPAKSLANAAATAATLLTPTNNGNSGSRKSEACVPTENIIGPLSAKQVLIIHNQRTERAAANASRENNNSPGNSIKNAKTGREHRKEGRRSHSRTEYHNSQSHSHSHRNSGSSTQSPNTKVLSPVVLPHRQTIGAGPDAVSSPTEGFNRPSLGISIPSNKFANNLNDSNSDFGGSPRSTTAKMSSRPRSVVASHADPLSMPSSSYEDILYSTSESNHSTPKSNQQQLSPIQHFGVPPSAIAGGSPPQRNAANGGMSSGSITTGSYPPPSHNGSIRGAIGNALGLVKGRLSSSVGASPAQSVQHSRTTSQNNSRAHSSDVDGNQAPTANVSSPIAIIRSKMGKADKLRYNVHRSFDQDDEYNSVTASTIQEDIEAMALRGSFSSDGEGEGDDRRSLYSDYSSRQVSTDSRQFSTDSRQYSAESRGSLRFSSMDLSMGNMDEDEEESAKTILSQHQLLYPPSSASAQQSYSPSYTYTSTNHTPVELFSRSVYSNKPLQKIGGTGHASSSARASSSSPHMPEALPTGGAAACSAGAAGSSASSPIRNPPLLLIEISDTGIGLSDSAMSALFTPFSQAQKLAGGTGLGLYSLSKRLDALGGHYGVECRKDGQAGSLFWFAIPYREDVDASLSFTKLQRSGSSRLEDLIMSSQPSLTHLMTSGDIGGPKSHVEDIQTTDSGKLVSEGPELHSEAAHHHPLNSVSHSSSSIVTGSTRTSQGSIAPLSPPLKNHSTPIAEERKFFGGDLPPKLHFLLVDDSETILKVTTMLLVRSGHTVESAENGVVALEKLTLSRQPGNRCFDVVVMDLQMPILDGLEATKRWREIEDEQEIAAAASGLGEGKCDERGEATSHQIVIGMSANADNDTIESAYAAGVDCFIEKPFTITKLIESWSELTVEREGDGEA